MALTEEQIMKLIEQEIPFVDIKPYSHNIIGLYLNLLSNRVGKEQVFQYIKNSPLIGLGWKAE